MAATVDMRAKMRFEVEARQALAETASLKKAQDDLAGGIASAGRAAAAAGQQIDVMGGATRASAEDILRAVGSSSEMASVAQIVRAAINPLVGEYHSLQQAMREISIAEGMGALSSREAALGLDQLQREANKLIAAMERAGVSIDGTSASMTRQLTSAQQLINATTGVNRATEESIADQLRHGLVLDDLRAKYNPLFAASRQYEQELRDIAEAERLGAISATEAAAARDRASAAMAPLPNQLRQVGAATQVAGHYAGQLSYQWNDIGMMMASGQNPFMLMIQQGPQVSQVLNDMRSRGMAVGPAIVGAFGMMLNPMSLATMAVIGFGAAAVQWLTDAGDAAEDFEDAFGRLDGAISGLKSAVQMLTDDNLEGLREKYGEINAELLVHIQRLNIIAQRDAMRETAASIGAIRESLTGGWLTTDVDDIRIMFDTTNDNARRLLSLMKQIEDATTVEARANAVATLRAHIETTSSAWKDAESEAGKNYDQIVLMDDKLRQVTHQMDLATGAATDFASTDMAGGVSAAADQARLLAAELGISLDLAKQLAGLDEQAPVAVAPRVEYDLPGITIPGSDLTPGGLTYGDNPGSGNGRSPGRTNTDTSSGSGRSSAGSAASKGDSVADLIKEQERQIKILAELDPVQQEILKNHEALANATKAETEAVEDNIRKRQELEEVRDTLNDIDQTGKNVFTGLASGALSFSDAIGMVLGKLAEMAGSSAWDMIWGSSDSGGFGVGDWLGGLLGLADGGRVTGPGGPREDKVLMWGSNGEFMINAAATAANLPLIEAINAGASPDQLMTVMGAQRLAAHADGGMIGSSALPSWRAAATNASLGAGATPSGSAGGKLRIEIVPVVDKSGSLTAHVRRVSREEASDVVVEGLSTFSADILPDRVAEIDARPRERG